jgi:N-acetylmuramoyl-L-alanine amidase
MASAIYRAFKQYKTEFEIENKPKEEEVIVVSIGLEYRIQFFTDRVMIELSDPRFSGLSDLDIYEQGGLYKYTSGHFTTFDEARLAISAVKAKGFGDAFVVAFKEGKRISISEARSLEDR